MSESEQTLRVHSIDGRTFASAVPLDTPLMVGDFVLLDAPGVGLLLGQVLDKRVTGRVSQTSGALRATIEPDGGVEWITPRPFADATMCMPPPEMVAAFQRWSGADLPVGRQVSADRDEAPALLRRKSFNRHTFICGQSGSGKTYALGVLLEQLLSETELPLIVIDPNADYVGLGQLRPEADAARAERLPASDVRVLRAASRSIPEGAEQLAVRFSDMTSTSKAAALRVDPIRDREEYNDLLKVLDESAGQQEVAEFADRLAAEGGTANRAVAQRIQNLGILRWDVWARGRTSLIDVVKTDPRALVLDVSGCRVPQER
jgi:uncharacterized protein